MVMQTELQNVWIGHPSYSGSSKINDGEWGMATLGEIMLRGHVEEGGRFVLEEVLRIAYAGFVEEADNPFGEVTIVGPLPETAVGIPADIEQFGASGDVSNLALQAHYRQLTLDAIESGYYLNNEREANDVRIPPVVRMNGRLHWEQIGVGTERPIRLAIDIQFNDDGDYNSGNGLTNLILQITIAPEEFEFYSVADAKPDESQEVVEHGSSFYRLCTRPQGLCADDAVHMLVRHIPIRFVCLFDADATEQAQILSLCVEQVNGVCEVWRDQTVLGAVVRYDKHPLEDPDAHPVVEFPGQLLATQNFRNDQSNWDRLIRLPAADAIWVVDVFIARDVIDEDGESIPGIAYDPTVMSAGVVLSFNALVNDRAHKYLLAHELGHCLGLEHPGLVTTVGGVALPQGSTGSVMEIANHHAPVNNSTDNCVIFSDGYALLNPMARVIWPLSKDCLRPLLP